MTMEKDFKKIKENGAKSDYDRWAAEDQCFSHHHLVESPAMRMANERERIL